MFQSISQMDPFFSIPSSPALVCHHHLCLLFSRLFFLLVSFTSVHSVLYTANRDSILEHRRSYCFSPRRSSGFPSAYSLSLNSSVSHLKPLNIESLAVSASPAMHYTVYLEHCGCACHAISYLCAFSVFLPFGMPFSDFSIEFNSKITFY